MKSAGKKRTTSETTKKIERDFALLVPLSAQEYIDLRMWANEKDAILVDMVREQALIGAHT